MLISPAELETALETRKVTQQPIVPLSAAWFLPNDPEGRTGPSSFETCRIPGSRFFDLDKIKDPNSPWPHMLPDSRTFANAAGKLGIRRTDTVVVYDTAELGIFSAPRVAWTFKVFRHPKVHVLNNFKLWVEEGRPTESGKPESVEPTSYEIPKDWSPSNDVVSFEEMQDKVKNAREQRESPILVDARPAGRFHGTSPEPRPGMPSGHMPGSISLPFSDVLDAQSKVVLAPEHLGRILKEKGIPENAEIVSSCGTGVTAAIVDLAIREAGWRKGRLYDGSWTEWASRLRAEDGWIQTSSSQDK